MHLKSLLILLWNARSLLANLDEFKKILDDNLPHISCITETWLKSKDIINFNGYDVLRNDREFGRKCGGVAFIINKHLNYSHLNLQKHQNGQMECIGIALNLNKTIVNILLCYNPNGNLDETELDFYRKQIKGNIIICGDFNAKHYTWNKHGTNAGGDTLYNYINTSNDLFLLTPPFLETRYNSYNNTVTTLDLFIGNTDMLLKTTDIKSFSTTGSSDHYPTTLSLDFDVPIVQFKSRVKWVLDEKLWDKWENDIKAIKITNENSENNVKIEELTKNILDTAKGVFKLTKGKVNERKAASWWTEECSKARALKRRAKQKLKRHFSKENSLNYNKLKADFKRTVKQTKRESWKTIV